mgnify:CR=1 FL=1
MNQNPKEKKNDDDVTKQTDTFAKRRRLFLFCRFFNWGTHQIEDSNYIYYGKYDKEQFPVSIVESCFCCKNRCDGRSYGFNELPNVRKLDCLSGFTILANRGLRDTCMIVLPIPIKEKAMNMLMLS